MVYHAKRLAQVSLRGLNPALNADCGIVYFRVVRDALQSLTELRHGYGIIAVQVALQFPLGYGDVRHAAAAPPQANLNRPLEQAVQGPAMGRPSGKVQPAVHQAYAVARYVEPFAPYL